MMCTESHSPQALYIHIPFCRRKCAYCDFNSYAGLDDLIEPYVEALQTEIRCLPATRPWRTIYFGGGTPSLLSLAQLGAVLTASRAVAGWSPGATCRGEAPEVEVTMEANPGTVDEAYLGGLRDLGVNRLSLGVQSFRDDELGLLGRIHCAQEAVEAFLMARAAGFENVNLDLMYGLPDQALAGWQWTLERAIALSPQHLSLYALTLEPGTPLAAAVEQGEMPAPDEDTAAQMYELAEDLLDVAGYEHYEISNWARPGHRCRHNLVYWRNEPYRGVGAGAHSWVLGPPPGGGRRYHNLPHPADYVRAIAEGRSPLAGEEAIGRELEMAETAMLGLRLTEGLRDADFRARFGLSLADAFGPAIRESAALGLLELDELGVRLTRRGRLLGNEVFRRFLVRAEAAV